MRSLVEAIGRSVEISWAFLKLGLSTAIKYPLGFATQQIGVIAPVLVYFFPSNREDRRESLRH